jgi:hypothetical protein
VYRQPLFRLALWRNADPDIPILKQAKAKYAKMDPTHKFY